MTNIEIDGKSLIIFIGAISTFASAIQQHWLATLVLFLITLFFGLVINNKVE